MSHDQHLLVLAAISEHLYIGAWLKDVQDRIESTIKPVNRGSFVQGILQRCQAALFSLVCGAGNFGKIRSK